MPSVTVIWLLVVCWYVLPSLASCHKMQNCTIQCCHMCTVKSIYSICHCPTVSSIQLFTYVCLTETKLYNQQFLRLQVWVKSAVYLHFMFVVCWYGSVVVALILFGLCAACSCQWRTASCVALSSATFSCQPTSVTLSCCRTQRVKRRLRISSGSQWSVPSSGVWNCYMWQTEMRAGYCVEHGITIVHRM